MHLCFLGQQAGGAEGADSTWIVNVKGLMGRNCENIILLLLLIDHQLQFFLNLVPKIHLRSFWILICI